MAIAEVLSSEAVLPVLASAAGVVAAMAFVVSGASSKGAADSREAAGGSEESVEPAATSDAGHSDAGGAVVAEAASDSQEAEAKEEAVSSPSPSEADENTSEVVSSGTDSRRKPRRRLTPEQEKKLEHAVHRLSPKSRKAIEEWITMGETDKWAVLGMQCLAIIMFLGLFICFAAFLIIAFQVNIFQPEVWRKGADFASQVVQDFRQGGGS
eukprot:CAMPEP_0170619490 /NCGR_PEP_ID=MMETSP0224-20130122/27543_1 /TAXON_ID=285029 /ORGANISM="Togula jolla, Strain CCCM 725" /LENGTH=210 /DNA_ID=CAMNT_0010945581 /DNA_START=56 /DNA_END=685 /DNA_ORIENTATION=-